MRATDRRAEGHKKTATKQTRVVYDGFTLFKLAPSCHVFHYHASFVSSHAISFFIDEK
jgi:hypothetical protein